MGSSEPKRMDHDGRFLSPCGRPFIPPAAPSQTSNATLARFPIEESWSGVPGANTASTNRAAKLSKTDFRGDSEPHAIVSLVPDFNVAQSLHDSSASVTGCRQEFPAGITLTARFSVGGIN
jgi:hypothetical protein